MRLLVIGATGRTGAAIVGQGLARGHVITALVRSPERITLTHANLTVRKGNVLEEPKSSKP